MVIKTPQEQQRITLAAQVSTQILWDASRLLSPGTTTLDIDNYIGELCKKAGVKPAFLGVYNGHNSSFKHNSCISVNDQILHGIPSSKLKLQIGDIVKLDFGLIKDGYYTDQCYTFAVKDLSPENERLLTISKLAISTAARKATNRNRAGDVGSTMKEVAELAGFNVLAGYTGHGIGHKLHDAPEVSPYARAGTGPLLIKQQVITVECQVMSGASSAYVGNDGWTVWAKDKRNAAMFEYMVIVGEQDSIIITEMDSWPFIV